MHDLQLTEIAFISDKYHILLLTNHAQKDSALWNHQQADCTVYVPHHALNYPTKMCDSVGSPIVQRRRMRHCAFTYGVTGFSRSISNSLR